MRSYRLTRSFETLPLAPSLFPLASFFFPNLLTHNSNFDASDFVLKTLNLSEPYSASIATSSSQEETISNCQSILFVATQTLTETQTQTHIHTHALQGDHGLFYTDDWHKPQRWEPLYCLLSSEFDEIVFSHFFQHQLLSTILRSIFTRIIYLSFRH